MTDLNHPLVSAQRFTIEIPMPDDALELQKMHNQSWLDTYPNRESGVSTEYIEKIIALRLSKEGLKRRIDSIQAAHDNPDYFLRIAKNESGKIVGMINGDFKDDTYMINGLYTKKETYGSGLGYLLWESYKSWADPLKSIELSVATYNSRARAFYTKLGFKDKPNTERYFRDTKIPIIGMVRIPQ
jgi:GNAT superfamily N-acetyltransferase